MPQLFVGDASGLPLFVGVCSWVGISAQLGGNPVLYQGGWEGQYNYLWWSYQGFVERWPDPAIIATNFPVGPGSNILCIVSQSGQNIWVTLMETGPYSYSQVFPLGTDPQPKFAQFIVETPLQKIFNISIGYMWLPSWSGEIDQFTPSVTFGGVTHPGSWFIANGGGYTINYWLMRTTYWNTNNYYYNTPNEHIATTYITSR